MSAGKIDDETLCGMALGKVQQPVKPFKAEERIAAARLRLRDLKGIHSDWYDGKDNRPEREIIDEIEQIAYSVSCYLDGVPGVYLRHDTALAKARGEAS